VKYLTYVIALLLLVCSSTYSKAKDDSKIDLKETKALGNELRKDLVDMFKAGTFLSQDDLLPDSEKGKQFDGNNLKSSPLALEIESLLKESKMEDIDEAEDFLQMSQQIIAQIDGIPEPEVEHSYREETCEESLSNVYRLKELREVTIIPEITETKKVCQGHKWTFVASFNTKKSIKELKKNIEKKSGTNITILGQRIDGRNVIVSYKHVNPDIKEATTANKLHTISMECFGAKTETIIIKPREEIIKWHPENETQLKYLKSESTCHLIDQSYTDSDTRYLVYHCESGANEKCQAIRDSGGILKDKECILEDPEGNCLRYLKTFSFETRKPIEQEYFLDGEELFNLEDFETDSEADGFFGFVLAKLATVFQSAMSAGQDMEQKDPMKSEVFPGQEMRCEKSCSTGLMIDCCGRDSIDFENGKCSADEEMLLQKRLEKKCHYVGLKDTGFGIYKEQVYICYPDMISRIIQEGAHKQLNIPWGEAEKPNKKGVILEGVLELDFDRIDFSDFEVDMKKKVDADMPKIMKKIQSTVESLRPETAKKQTENLLKEDMKRCLNQ
jgi:hypothetical protein